MKPFLKWAGNKYRIIEHIKKVLPKGKRLVEPFVGAAAVFLNTDYDSYLLTDNNADLIQLFQVLQREGPAFIEFARAFFTPESNQEAIYYQNRTLFNQTTDLRLKSALFLYMNKHGYNGLCRYNQQGEFNVPFGRHTQAYFPEEEMLFFYEKAQRAEFATADFVAVMENGRSGDIFYCDPPYVPLSETANFTSYSSDKFTLAQQAQLAQLAVKLSERGIPVILSNHDTPFTRQSYTEAEIHAFPVRRTISRNGSKRGKAKELLAVFTPKPKKSSQSSGGWAAKSGNTLEKTVIGTLSSKGFETVMYRQWQKDPDQFGSELLLRNVPYTTIYGHPGNTEFLLRSAHYRLELRIECKWQQSAGSVDEKFPYLYLNAVEAMPEKEIIIIVDGGGAKPGAVQWLRQTSHANRYRTPNTLGKQISVMNLTEFLAWANKTFR